MASFPGTILVCAVGKIKADFYRQAQDEYVSRIRRYVRLDIQEIRDQCRAGNDSAGIRRESQTLHTAIQAARHTVLLDIRGKAMSSESFAETLLRPAVEGHQSLAFAVGGPYGVDPGTVSLFDQSLSLSPMTLPHEMARVILLEQIFRAFSILSGEKYHKGNSSN